MSHKKPNDTLKPGPPGTQLQSDTHYNPRQSMDCFMRSLNSDFRTTQIPDKRNLDFIKNLECVPCSFPANVWEIYRRSSWEALYCRDKLIFFIAA